MTEKLYHFGSLDQKIIKSFEYLSYCKVLSLQFELVIPIVVILDIAYCFECFPSSIAMSQINFTTFGLCVHSLKLRQDPLPDVYYEL